MPGFRAPRNRRSRYIFPTDWAVTWFLTPQQKQIDGELDKLLRDISPAGAAGGGGRSTGSLGSKAGAKVAAALLSEASGAKLGILPTQKIVDDGINGREIEKRTVRVEQQEQLFERKAKEETGGKNEHDRLKLTRRRSAPAGKKGDRLRLHRGDPIFGLCDECSLLTEDGPWAGEYKHEREKEKIKYDSKHLDELVVKMMDKHSGLPLRKKKMGLLKLTTILYFTGTDLIDWLLKRCVAAILRASLTCLGGLNILFLHRTEWSCATGKRRCQ